MIGSLASGTTAVEGFPASEDNDRTLQAFLQMDVPIEKPRSHCLAIKGQGLRGLREPQSVIDAGNSGTTMRLLSGVLSGQRFFSVLTGDASLTQRPMKRVVEPLRMMGATIFGRDGGNYPPLAIQGTELRGIDYRLPVASAQVKSAILLAGLFAEGKTSVEEPAASRDHTERMLASHGATLSKKGGRITVTGGVRLKGGTIVVPGDISSAAFVIVAALITEDSDVTVNGVGINPTRTGILDVLSMMGADLEITNEREVSGEPIADIRARSSALKGVRIEGEVIPRTIDELPLLAVAASAAQGETAIKDAGELRVKETDRIKAMVSELTKLGVAVEELEDGMAIEGGKNLEGATCMSHGDHRTAMALAVAGLTASGETVVQDTACVRISFPSFASTLNSLWS
jgi:3-phosphoshikimate 1-carboxyvinyltransferase